MYQIFPTLDAAVRCFSQSMHMQLHWFAARGTAVKQMETFLRKAKCVMRFNKLKYVRQVPLRYQMKLEWIHLLSHSFIQFEKSP